MAMTTTIKIKDFYGRVIGTIDTDAQGNKIARDFYRRIVGKYDKRTNTTRDFYGRVVARGDAVSTLIPPIDQQK